MRPDSTAMTHSRRRMRQFSLMLGGRPTRDARLEVLRRDWGGRGLEDGRGVVVAVLGGGREFDEG